MTFSMKTMIISAVLFASSIIIVGTMHLPIFGRENGFQAMETTFNSLRKGLRPPFDRLEKENDRYLGRNFKATIVFGNNDQARTATVIFLANKLTVTPRGNTVSIQGDLGYTLKYFMNDIQLLYRNNFKQLEKRYSMPAMQSMYVLDRILKKMAISFASNKWTDQEKLIDDIREQLLIPAYNLREAQPISDTSGFIYLALGTLGILLFAMLWDIANYMFFGTLVSEKFMKGVRIALGRELSDAEKATLRKRQAILAKKKAMMEKAKEAKARKMADEMILTRKEGTKTNKEAMRRKTAADTELSPAQQQPLKKNRLSAQQKEKKTAAQRPANKKSRTATKDEQKKNSVGKKEQLLSTGKKTGPSQSAKRKTAPPSGTKKITQKKRNTAPESAGKQRPGKSEVKQNGSPERKQTVKNRKKPTSQTESNKVTTRRENRKTEAAQQDRKNGSIKKKPQSRKQESGPKADKKQQQDNR